MEQKNIQDGLMDKITALAKRRGFIYPGSDIYGGLANTWDFGPLGTELKNNIKQSWWKTFVHGRDDMYGLDAAIIMNRRVWQASGHEKGFNDPLVECKNNECHARIKAADVKLDMLSAQLGKRDDMEQLDEFQLAWKKDPYEAPKDYSQTFLSDVFWSCKSCGEKNFVMETKPRRFNLMFKTFIGSVEESANTVYLRPETAQGIFTNFKNIVDTIAPKLPFGIAQIGKAFRNEITPGNFIFRTREFEQMEIEYFINPDDDWKKHFERWLKETNNWLDNIGVDKKHVHDRDIPKDELAHYSQRTVDVEFDFTFGRKELWGLAYRTDFDLKAHQKESGVNLEYFDPETKKRFIPHVIEPSLGVERTALAVLVSAYREDKDRVYLDFPPPIAPYKAAVFPLLANKPELVKEARALYEDLKKAGVGPIAWDDRGNIGKRYYAQDEIGTPFCFTVDFKTLEDGTITIRDRNTTKQERVLVKEAATLLREKLK
jgi:glycyl-tRNA synthetase